jgi:hypothetical protein
MTSHVHESINTRTDRHGTLNRKRPVLAALYLGLTTTFLATIAPYLDQATSHTLAHHIRAGYPSYTQARIDTAVHTYQAILTIIGVLGVAGWALVIRAVTTGKRWAGPLATLAFILGLGTALTGLLIKDTSGVSGLSPLLGWVGIVPCLPGLVAVKLVWRNRAVGPETAA